MLISINVSSIHTRQRRRTTEETGFRRNEKRKSQLIVSQLLSVVESLDSPVPLLTPESSNRVRRSCEVEQGRILSRVERRRSETGGKSHSTENEVRHENSESCEREAESEGCENSGTEGSSSGDFSDEMSAFGRELREEFRSATSDRVS